MRNGQAVWREAGADDLAGLLELYTQLHENPMPQMDDRLGKLWEQILQDKKQHIIIAERGGKIVSSCICVIVPNLTHGQRPYALIENVITDAACRRTGLAARCLEYAFMTAKENNCYKIMLLTGAKDPGTLSFYEKAGFNRQDKTAFIKWL